MGDGNVFRNLDSPPLRGPQDELASRYRKRWLWFVELLAFLFVVAALAGWFAPELLGVPLGCPTSVTIGDAIRLAGCDE